MNNDDLNKERQSRVKRREIAKKYFKRCLIWLRHLWLFYKSLDLVDLLISYLIEGDGSGPLDNYIYGSYKDDKKLQYRSISSL